MLKIALSWLRTSMGVIFWSKLRISWRSLRLENIRWEETIPLFLSAYAHPRMSVGA